MTEWTHDLPTEKQGGSRHRRWLARLGVWGFLFFLVKGLAWLMIPALLAMRL